MRLIISALAAALFISGCATQTVYKPADRRGDVGYTETKLADNRFRITFIGNSITPQDTVKDYALLRAAEVTLQEGGDWFQIASRDESQKQRQTSTVGGGVDLPSQTTVYQRCGLVHCNTAVATSPGFDSGLETGVTSTASAYSSSIEIAIGKKPMPKSVDSYDARQLVQTLHRDIQQR